jgi:hypothetical protein
LKESAIGTLKTAYAQKLADGSPGSFEWLGCNDTRSHARNMQTAISIAIDMRRRWRSNQESATEGHTVSGSSTCFFQTRILGAPTLASLVSTRAIGSGKFGIQEDQGTRAHYYHFTIACLPWPRISL